MLSLRVAIVTTGHLLDVRRKRCRVLHSTNGRFEAESVHSEFEEWLNPSGDWLPLMTCPRPSNG